MRFRRRNGEVVPPTLTPGVRALCQCRFECLHCELHNSTSARRKNSTRHVLEPPEQGASVCASGFCAFRFFYSAVPPSAGSLDPTGGRCCCSHRDGPCCVADEMTSPPERLCASTHPAHIQSYPRRGVGCASGCGTGGLQQLAWKGAAHTKQDSSVCGGVGIAPHAEHVRVAARAACWFRAAVASWAAAIV